MQTKKKVGGRNTSKEVSSPKASRHHNKLSEDVKVQEKRATELITSSARKHRLGVTYSKKSVELVATTNLTTACRLVDEETATIATKDNDDGNGHQVTDSIFSPAFHTSRNPDMEMNGANFIKFFQNSQVNTVIHEENNFDEDEATSMNLSCNGGGSLSSDVSSVYLSLKDTKMECIDEYNQDHTSADVCVEDEEFDDFDPYLFIKNLPELSSVVPTFRPVLLPKQTRSCPPTTLVLDLDETLVHSMLEPCEDADFTFTVNFNLMEHSVYVRCRPHLKDFMERVSGLFEIIIFTASQSIYAEQLLNVLDPKRKVFRHRVYRESCVYVDGNYVKDLSVLGRDLAHVIMVDNSPQAFGFQVDNGIPIESWFEDRSDKELLSLIPFLESLIGVEDVRPVIAKRFNLRDKIAAAVCSFNPNSDHLFER
jgi:CTD small phosphatase-like protein 2